MMTAAGIILKVIFSRLAQFAAFAIERWRVFLPLVMVALALWHYMGLRGERDDAVQALINYRAEVADAQRQRRVQNVAIEQQLQLVTQIEQQKHAAETETIRRSYNALKHDKADAVATAGDLRRRLRAILETTHAATGMPGGGRGPIRLTESGGNCDAAGAGHGPEKYLETLEHACAITTSDYNTLWTRCDAVNRIYGKQTRN